MPHSAVIHQAVIDRLWSRLTSQFVAMQFRVAGVIVRRVIFMLLKRSLDTGRRLFVRRYRMSCVLGHCWRGGSQHQNKGQAPHDTGSGKSTETIWNMPECM